MCFVCLKEATEISPSERTYSFQGQGGMKWDGRGKEYTGKWEVLVIFQLLVWVVSLWMFILLDVIIL